MESKSEFKEKPYYMKKKQNERIKQKKTVNKPVEIKLDDFDEINLNKLSDATISKNVEFNNNLINIESVYKFIDLFFKQKNIMYTHLYNSFDKLLDEDIPTFLKNANNTFFEKITKDKVYKYKFKYDNLAIKPPFIDMDDEIMFPQNARIRNLTYSSKLIATITQVQEIIDIATGSIESRIIGQAEHEYPITNMPIMVNSKYCSLNLKKGYNNDECELDPGGYFIVNGSEKVVMALERMIDNRPLVFIKKDSSSINYTVQVNSKSHKNDLMQIINIRMKKDNLLNIRIPILNEIPVFILMRALGVEADKDIINFCVYDHDDIDMINIIRISLENSKPEKETIKIVSQIDALNYLTTKMRVLKKYNETDKDIKQQEKRLHLKSLLEDNFLPHVEGTLTEKAFFLGYMINRLLQCYLGRIKIDDRDSFINKRIDLPGQLIFDLFKQFYKKMLNECNKFFKKRNPDDNNPLNVINQIKPNIIEQGLKTALLTGAWGKKKGVAQMLQRLTYLQTLSSLRRLNSPTVDASTNKLTSPRHLHSTTIGPCCLTWDSEILLDDGITVKRIGEMTNSDCVTTINKNDLSTEPSRIRDKFVKMPNKLLKITTISGRVLKCTDDHPILIKIGKDKYEMREAGKLKKDDCVIIKHTQKYIPVNNPVNFIIKSQDVAEQYKLDLLKIGLLDKEFRQEQLEIMARLLGANITDGHIHIMDKYYTCIFSVGEMKDAYDLTDDIMKLGFGAPSIQREITHFEDETNNKTVEYKTYRVSKNGAFAYFMYLIGAFSGKKTTQIRKLPEWILNANDRIIREFISGFQGGDGSKLCAQKNKYGGHKLHIHATGQTTINTYLNETIEYMNSISKLLLKLNITSNIKHYINKKKPNKSSVHLYIENTNQNLTKYVDLIGYRYCQEKKRNSALPIEYVKCKNYIIESKIEKYEKLIEVYKNDVGDKSFCKKIQELGFNSKTAYKIINRYKNTGRIISPKSFKFEDYKTFAEKYMEKNDVVSIAIDKIEEIPIEPVYDFTTISKNHSFIANGIGLNNCFIETSEGFILMALLWSRNGLQVKIEN